MVAITVRNNNVDQAMRILKKKLQKEGVLREIKSRQYFEKPSAKRARKKAEGVKRYKRAEKKRLERFN
jgi:small subunit ribosomal protein S21